MDEVLAESDEAVPLWTLEPWESAFHDAVAPLYERQLLLAPPGMPSESSDVAVGRDPHTQYRCSLTGLGLSFILGVAEPTRLFLTPSCSYCVCGGVCLSCQGPPAAVKLFMLVPPSSTTTTNHTTTPELIAQVSSGAAGRCMEVRYRINLHGSWTAEVVRSGWWDDVRGW